MTYKVVHAKNVEDLAYKVNASIKAGFKCQGGVSISMVGRSEYQKESVQLVQAMIYYPTKANEC